MDIAIQQPWLRRALSLIYQARLFDPFFGEGLYDYDLLPLGMSLMSPYYRHLLFRSFLDSTSSRVSEVRSDRDKFAICLDVKHFSPEEINVKLVDDYVEIHGKHAERQDDHGYVSREFHRRYHLPSDVDLAGLTCILSQDGMLSFCAPKVPTSTDSSRGDSSRGDRSLPVGRDDKPNTVSS